MSEIYTSSALSHKKWIGLTYDWDMMIQGLTGLSCLVCLTDFELAWLQANVVYMTWASRWTNCPCTPEELQNMGAVLERKLMTCVNINPYQIQALYDQQVADDLDLYDALYNNGGIPNLNPATPTDFYSGDGSQERLDALCTAINIYVYSYAQDWVSKAQVILGAVFIISLISSLTLVGGIISVTIVGGLAFITQIAIDAMQDKDALDDVVCCMNTALIGTTIDNANFLTSLDNCNFTAGSNQAIIRDILASDIAIFNNWLTFINSVGDALAYVQNGIIDCPCDSQKTVIVTFDSLVNIDYVVTQSSPQLVTIQQSAHLQNTQQGNPTPAARMAFGNFMNGDEGFDTTVRIDLGADFDLIDVGFEYYFFRQTSINIVNRDLRLLDSSNNLIAQLQTSANTGIQNSWTNFGGSLSANAIRYIDCRMALSLTPPSPTPSNTMAWIDNVTFTKILT